MNAQSIRDEIEKIERKLSLLRDLLAIETDEPIAQQMLFTQKEDDSTQGESIEVATARYMAERGNQAVLADALVEYLQGFGFLANTKAATTSVNTALTRRSTLWVKSLVQARGRMMNAYKMHPDAFASFRNGRSLQSLREEYKDH
ncbi:MAG: hypothetical protein SGI88_09925 [Candidatus Hydrogenedentes bacterium]|nr:hypothetical protein [Candidatus Hydrogenedentota bacterium]